MYTYNVFEKKIDLTLKFKDFLTILYINMKLVIDSESNSVILFTEKKKNYNFPQQKGVVLYNIIMF